MNPYDNDDEYSHIILAGKKSPGVARISGHDRAYKWDNAAPKGSKGAVTKLQGEDLAQFQVSFYLAGYQTDGSGADEFAQWRDFAQLVSSSVRGPTPKALSIYHPDLAAVGITEVVAANQPVLNHDGKGGAIVVLKLQEYSPEKPKPVKRAEPAPDVNIEFGEIKVDPNSRKKAELAKLIAQAGAP